MKYLWHGYSPEKIYRLGPGSEELASGDGPICHINPLFRLQDVFMPCLIGDWSKTALSKELVEDVFAHVTAWLDNLSGVRPSTLAQSKIRQKLLDGDYGEEAGQCFGILSASEKKAILRLLQQTETGDGRCFLAGLRAFYPYARAYRNEEDGRLIVALPAKEDGLNQSRIALLEALFLPLGTPAVRYFWGNGPSLIENPDTMRIGRIKLY